MPEVDTHIPHIQEIQSLVRLIIEGMMGYTRIIAAALVVAGLSYQINLDGGLNRFTYDSFRYLAGAEAISQTGSYLDISGEPQRVWPPGTSLMLAAIMLITSLDYDKSTLIMGFISTLVAAFSFWTILRRAIDREWLLLLAFAALILNIGFLSLQQKLLSDPMALALAIASMSFAIAALGKKSPNWYYLFLAACLLISIAIIFRFAMIGALPVLCAVGFWCSQRQQSHRYAALLPLLSPLPQVLCSSLLDVPILDGRVSNFRPIDLADDIDAIVRISDQFVPVKVFTSFISVILSIILIIIIPLYFSISKNSSKIMDTILVSLGFIFSYFMFILISQSISTPSFQTDFRILLPIIPFSIVSLAVTIELIMSKDNGKLRFLSLMLICFLAITTFRAARAAMLVGLADKAIPSVHCMSREQLALHIRANVGVGAWPTVLGNSQGQVWYALRSTVKHLTEENLRNAPPGSLIVYTKMINMCDFVENYGAVDEAILLKYEGLKLLRDTESVFVFEKVISSKRN